MKFIKLIKASLTEQEINQAKNKFNSYKWSDIELYNPDVDDDYEAWDRLIDIIKDDYLEDNQNADPKDYEKIIGMTFEEFKNKRQEVLNKRSNNNKLEKLKEDLSTLENIIDDINERGLNFDYSFLNQLTQDRYDVEDKIKELEGK